MIRLRWLVLGVLALPFAEFFAFWWVAARAGALVALVGVVATSALGVLLLKGGAKLLLAQVASGRVVVLSGEAARSGVMMAFAGLLLALPGFLTDVLALMLIAYALLSRTRSDVAAAGPARSPAPPGVVDLDPADWREDAARDPVRRRIRRPEKP